MESYRKPFNITPMGNKAAHLTYELMAALYQITPEEMLKELK